MSSWEETDGVMKVELPKPQKTIKATFYTDCWKKKNDGQSWEIKDKYWIILWIYRFFEEIDLKDIHILLKENEINDFSSKEAFCSTKIECFFINQSQRNRTRLGKKVVVVVPLSYNNPRVRRSPTQTPLLKGILIHTFTLQDSEKDGQSRSPTSQKCVPTTRRLGGSFSLRMEVCQQKRLREHQPGIPQL